MTGKPQLQFWYDHASTYSYPAAMQIEAEALMAGVEVVWRPFLLGPIFAAQGWTDSPFNLYPAKGRYMWRDLERICDDLDLIFRRPAEFPQHSVLSARVALLGAAESWVSFFSRGVFEANFVHGRSISDPAVLSEILEMIGKDPVDILRRAQTPEHKERLKVQVALAQELGIFGAPTFIADGELFWGFDRLSRAIAWAKGERP